MDSQAACFPGQILANQLGPFPRNYPRVLHPFDMRSYSPDDKDDKELYHQNVRYPASVRRTTEFPVTNDNNGETNGLSPQQINGSEPADLSVKNAGEAAGKTRLLREILRGGKNDDDGVEDENGSNPGSSFDEDSEAETGSKDEGVVLGNDEQNTEGGTATKKARVENIVSNIRAPSATGTSSSENSGSDGVSRKTKRKQICPQQQVERDPTSGMEKEVMRRQLTMMQEKIEVMQNGHQQNGRKRRHEGIIGEDVILSHVQQRLQMAGGNQEAVAKLASLISTEIQEQINPIISSVLSKYLQSPKENGIEKRKSPTRTPTPAPEIPTRSPPVKVDSVKNAEKPKQPVNDPMHPMKHFNPMYGLGFPPRPFFGNENIFEKNFLGMAQLANLTGQAPTMFAPHFQHFFNRPSVFPEQTEAIPLVTQRKKRHKVTDTRITPRVVNKIISQKEEAVDGRKFLQPSPSPVGGMVSFAPNVHSFLARSLDRQASLNHSEASPFHPSMVDQNRHLHPMSQAFFPHNAIERREDSPTNGSMGSPLNDMNDNSLDMSDGSEAEMSASSRKGGNPYVSRGDSLGFSHSSTLTPMHLRKAKLMFFYTRYPNSATLKTFFPDIKFNKNNTAQLVKWFSNFREFYYIQMDKYARQAIAEGTTNADDIHVSRESELFRILNLHYNRNNHIEVPDSFRGVVEETLKEFFKAIQSGRDQEPSWKKAIYKIINRMDDSIPEFFKSSRFLDQLE